MALVMVVIMVTAMVMARDTVLVGLMAMVMVH